MPDRGSNPIYIMGDVHGYSDRLRELLRTADLIGPEGQWNAGPAELWFVGDYVDNGPDGLGTLELIMQLEQQAQAAGGRVGALLGNHDVQLLAARALGEAPRRSTERSFHQDWLENGGAPHDLENMTDAQAQWLADRPVAALVADTLLLHADSLFYLTYGTSLQALNQTVQQLLRAAVPNSLDRLLIDFTQHRDFLGPRGRANLLRLQKHYGGRRLVHGHTPISKITGEPAEAVVEAYVYLDGDCVNVDGGMYLGGPGFIYPLPEA